MVEEHARRPVHLGHDNAFSAVDHEGAVLGHERHFAHEHRLVLDSPDGARIRFFVEVEYDQAQRDRQRRGVSLVALLAFVDVELGGFKLVAQKMQFRGVVVIPDREHGLEHALETLVVQVLLAVSRIQKQVVRALLNLDQVRHFDRFADLAVVPPDALPRRCCLVHGRSSSVQNRSEPLPGGKRHRGFGEH